MQLIDHPGPLRREVRAPLIEQGKHRGDVLGYDRVSFPLQCSDAGRRSRIDHIVLAPSTAGQLPHPRGRRRRYVLNHLAAGQQPLRQMAPQTSSVLHRPTPLTERACPLQQPAVAGQRRLNLQRRDLPVRDRLHDTRHMHPLVRIHSDDDHADPFHHTL